MSEYFTTPFPFHKIINKSKSIKRLGLEASIRSNIRSLVLMRVGEFAYDRTLGFEMWEFDKQVFYHEREPYYENKKTSRPLIEQANAKKYFQENLEKIIRENEIRLQTDRVKFDFEKVDGNRSVYQRKIVIIVEGKVKSTGKILKPAFKMSILYTPFKVESN